MRLGRVMRLLSKDLSLGPRSPFFMLFLVWPLVLTLLIQLVFGELFAPSPRLGVVAEDNSALARATVDYPGIAVTEVASRTRLEEMVAAGDVDVGWVIPAAFDRDLGAGSDPRLDVSVAGDSLASNRILVAIAVADLIRAAAPRQSIVEVDVVAVGDGDALSIETRLIPVMVLLAVMIAGVFLPASSIVDEKVAGTMTAMLVTPMTMGEFLAGKAALGFILAMSCGVMTLLLNGALSGALLPLLVILAVAALMMAELGLLLGCAVDSTNMLFTVWKGGTLPFFLPVIPYLWEAFPLWLARLSPTYYFMDPAWRVVVEDATLAEVAPTLAIGVAIIVACLPLVAWMGRRNARAMGAA